MHASAARVAALLLLILVGATLTLGCTELVRDLVPQRSISIPAPAQRYS